MLTSRGQDTRVPRDQDTSDVSFNVHNPASMMLNLVNCNYNISISIKVCLIHFNLVDALDEPVGDADSGMSTSHSPEDNFKQFSRQDQGNEDLLVELIKIN